MDPRFARVEDGRISVDFHPGQARAWRSEKRFVAITAGTQSGKTTFAPFWYWREIQRCGPGDYIAATPTYPLLNLKVLPSFLWLFDQKLKLGSYNKTDHIFTFSPYGERRAFGSEQAERTQVFFGYAENPDSLESATAKAAWLDEAGQKKFKLESWEAILRRLSIHQGRALITTTLYNLGWYVQNIYRPAERGERDDIDLIRFESKANPSFPLEEWERAKTTLPRWKFDLFYRGIPTRPAGLIYDNFDPDRDTVEPFTLDPSWPRYVGLDFGGVNTAALFYAEDPSTRIENEPGSGMLYLYREYKAGGRTAAQHAQVLRSKVGSGQEAEPMPSLICGGSPSEGQWRDEFRAAGLPVEGPDIADVEVGIQRVYRLHAEHRIKVFTTCKGYLDEKASYARKLDDKNQPTEKIEDKNSYHFMDAERYVIGKLAAHTEFFVV